MKRKDFEVMAPVGSYESLEAALQAGANSVYFGVEGLNMRSRSSANFTLDDLRNIVERCNAREVKTYLTVNTIIYNNELEKMHQVIECAKDAGVSAIIASDIAAILYARSIGVEVHISTQCNITNYEAVKFYAQFADVVVLARELDMDQVMNNFMFDHQCIPFIRGLPCQTLHPAYKNGLTKIIQSDRYKNHQDGNNRFIKSICNFRVYPPTDKDFVHPAS